MGFIPKTDYTGVCSFLFRLSTLKLLLFFCFVEMYGYDGEVSITFALVYHSQLMPLRLVVAG